MKIVRDLNLPFYLTGGTALSRFYYKHRYSDDLDFFVNSDNNFQNYVKTLFSYFENNKTALQFELNIERVIISSTFARAVIFKNDFELKVDFVNDIPVHFGDIIEDPGLGLIDNWRNILSNKISALLRFELKDYVDIWVISKHNRFNWKDIIREAKEKDLSVDPLDIYNLFRSFPFKDLRLIKWIAEINLEEIQKDFSSISGDILEGGDNSLMR